MPTLGPIDLVLAVLIALTIFGPERLPAAARALRRIYRFKRPASARAKGSERAPTPDVEPPPVH